MDCKNNYDKDIKESKEGKRGIFRTRSFSTRSAKINSYNDNYEIIKNAYVIDIESVVEYNKLKRKVAEQGNGIDSEVKKQLGSFNESDVFLKRKNADVGKWLVYSIISFSLSYFTVTCGIAGFIFLCVYFNRGNHRKSIIEYNRGVESYNSGEIRRSIEYFKNAYQLDENNIENLAILSRLMHKYNPEICYNYIYAVKKAINYMDFYPIDIIIGEMEYKLGNYKKALPYLKKKLDNDLNKEEMLKYTAMVGRCFYELGEHKNAIEILYIDLVDRKMVKDNIDDLLYWLALSEYELGDKKEALGHLNKIYSNNPDYKNISKLIKQFSEDEKNMS